MKTKFKSLISIILSIMMVLSMVIVAVPVNAATVEDNSVEATTYYMYYGTSNIISDWDISKRVTMTDNGDGTYSGSFSGQQGNNFITFNTSTSAVISKNYWSSTNDVRIKTTINDDNVSGYYGQESNFSNTNYYFLLVALKKAGTISVTFTPSSTINSSTISISSGTSTTTYTVSDLGLPTGASMTFSNTQGGASATSFEPNSTVYVEVTPPEGQECTGITVNGATVSGTGNSYSFTMPSSNVTVSATFSSSSSDMTTYNKNETSGKTLVVSYDTTDTWKGIYLWNTNNSSYNNKTDSMIQVSGVTGHVNLIL